MVTEGADSLSLAAVCCVMSREGQTKQLHPALGRCFVLVFLARAIFFGEIEWERGPSQPLRGMSDFHLRKDLLGRSDILTSQADSQS